MHRPIHPPPQNCSAGLRYVEIRLWGNYFLTGQNGLPATLSAFALEGRPIEHHPEDAEQQSYHFLESDWENTLKSLLTKHSIAFEVVKNLVKEGNAKNKVYLVEDDLNILFAMNTVLEGAGYDVLLSHSAKPLMEDVLPPTDLFILDKCMGDGDGLEVYHKLRSRTATKNTPVIMTSCHRSIRAQAIAAGVDDFLLKPFELGDLLRIVSKHMGVN